MLPCTVRRRSREASDIEFLWVEATLAGGGWRGRVRPRIRTRKRSKVFGSRGALQESAPAGLPVESPPRNYATRWVRPTRAVDFPPPSRPPHGPDTPLGEPSPGEE